MAFSFGAQKTVTGFTLPTTSTPATSTSLQFNASGASGDLNTASQPKPPNLISSTIPSSTGISTSTAAAPAFNIGGSIPTSAVTSALPTFNTGSTLTSTASNLPLFPLTAPANKPATGFSLGATPGQESITSTPSLTFGAPATSTSLGATPSVSTSAATSIIPATGSMTFSQLEDAINKWTVDLDEQGKLFANQAKHLNAWDRLLISNGEKILNVSNGIDKIKDQQRQLDQELDFVLAQQKELEDCIVPLENELKDVSITDLDRDQTYKLAENIDAHLKQMSEDLKEIIEQINESNKAQELSDPVAQIGRILNAHMNSLQWIDRNTSQISSHLDDIAKMHDVNKKHHDHLHD